MSRALPKFSDLPLNKGDPPHSAWGVYGSDDELGTINRLTDDVVMRAKEEIQRGVRISLNLPLNAQRGSMLVGRSKFHMDQYNKAPRIVNDDVWTFNSQTSTQWDGLRHYAYQKEAKFYNGVTLDDIFGENRTLVNGIQAWEEKGIVGRGVLLDFDRWRRANNVEYRPLVGNRDAITLDHLKAVARSQGTEIKFGDILIIRTGFTVAYNKLTDDEITQMMSVPVNGGQASGVEQSDAMLEWLWDSFSAVASDNPTFERWPSTTANLNHEILLSGWGMPIGEWFNLENLADHCEKVGRWSFFVASEVCNVPGAVARYICSRSITKT
ncbi:hypothetical protein OIDMADRAFT_45284 [Oidiodendron maius Zn]|uniref:Cyclase n=1 Tax=Oidiodendron maius (strain Zn) TaxID=913774 RepID=A0A0C3GVZ2_OIDMZ|nr:hypothetical protein OIDMADRAFT_45284 [Oidiodendron maius Zn]